MLRIRTFQGLRPTPESAPFVACVPYDVVDRKEALALAEGNSQSLLHVDRAEIDLPADTDPYSQEVYAKALVNFRGLQMSGSLVRESERCVYIYRQTMGNHSQTGIATVCHIEDYEQDIIKKHEKTRKDKEADRTRLIDTISANTGPVFLTYRDQPAIDQLVKEETASAPLFDFTAVDGIRHTVWRGTDGERIVKLFGELPAAYVADGHHRTASAASVGRQRRENNPLHNGLENYNWFLAVLFPASQLRILPYNRAVSDLNGHNATAFLAEVKKRFTVREGAAAAPDKPGNVSMYLSSKWYGLSWAEDRESDPVSRLDVSVLQDKLLCPILGIEDPRTSKRIDFIGGIRGTQELTTRVNSGRDAVAFSMFPTTVEQLMTIADAGQIMPPKSTWFEPKLRSGLFIHTLD